jgi:hypothetical protein
VLAFLILLLAWIAVTEVARAIAIVTDEQKNIYREVEERMKRESESARALLCKEHDEERPIRGGFLIFQC